MEEDGRWVHSEEDFRHTDIRGDTRRKTEDKAGRPCKDTCIVGTSRARTLWYFGSKCYMFSHLLPGFSCGSKHLLLPSIHGIVNLMHFGVMFVMRSSTQPKTTAHKIVNTILLP